MYEHPHRKNKTEEIPFIFTFPLTKYYPHKSQETFILSKQKTLQTTVISFDYGKILEIMQNNYSSLWKVHFCPNFLCPHLGCLCFHHSFLHDDYVVDTFIHHKKNKKAIPRVKKQQFVGAFTRSIIFTARKCKEFAISLLFGYVVEMRDATAGRILGVARRP